MSNNLLPSSSKMAGNLRLIGLGVFVLGGVVRGQESAPVVDKEGWERYDWLKPSEDDQRQAASGESIKAQATQNVSDPFAVVSGNTLDQQVYSTTYTRKLADTLSLTFETSSTLQSENIEASPTDADGSPDDLALGQKVGVQYQPMDGLKLQANVHESTTDSSLPGEEIMTSGTGVYIEGKIPTNTTLSLGLNSDRTGTDPSSIYVTTDNSYDTQVQQPLGNLPLTAVLKAHYEQIQVPGAPAGSFPSLEQSLVWKPVSSSTIQAGLRQQQYQEYPGIDNQTNQALFADWSQKIMGDITWHSYAELVNTKSLIDQAPVSPIASGANGTAQVSGPSASGTGLTDSLPVSMQDQTVTFSTGPSFQLEKDISASVEYSNRWDKTPAPGSVGQEQRVSVSVKGSF